MEENNQRQPKRLGLPIGWVVLGIFALAIILICGFVFIYGYNEAYDNDAGEGWLPPSFAMIFYYFLIVVVSIIAAVILKLSLKKRVRIWALLLSAVLLPVLCYHFNYHTLKKDGPLYPLVDEGGLLHFLTIGDYNFDGINDEEYHLLYDERKYTSRYSLFDDTIIDYIDTIAVGTGIPLNRTFCFYDCEERVIDLHFARDDVQFKQIEIVVSFQDPTLSERTSFYLRETLLNHTVNEDHSVSIIFDADTCAEWQKYSGKTQIKIPIKYVVTH